IYDLFEKPKPKNANKSKEKAEKISNETDNEIIIVDDDNEDQIVVQTRPPRRNHVHRLSSSTTSGEIRNRLDEILGDNSLYSSIQSSGNRSINFDIVLPRVTDFTNISIYSSTNPHRNFRDSDRNLNIFQRRAASRNYRLYPQYEISTNSSIPIFSPFVTQVKKSNKTNSPSYSFTEWSYFNFDQRALGKHATDDKKSNESSSCSICLDKYEVGDKMKTIPCMHFFHSKCIDNWLLRDSTCPM
ncbi:MAG: E3 ubiquitin-protein ligase znrf3, partial [Paramarteilia canceri]